MTLVQARQKLRSCDLGKLNSTSTPSLPLSTLFNNTIDSMAPSKSVEDVIKTRLGIKWSAAKELAAQAAADIKESTGQSDIEDDEIVEEACDIFEDLDEDEKEEMRLSAQPVEPHWKRKAREQAEKREREFDREQQAQAVAAAGPTVKVVEVDEDGRKVEPKKRKVRTEVTRIKRVNGKEVKEVTYEERELEPTSVKTVYCCTIL